MSKTRVMLLGDSWRQFYENAVRKNLGEEFEVWSPGDENGRFAAYTLNSFRFWREAFPSPDVIHYNTGLWDCGPIYAEDGPFTPLDEYLALHEKIVREMKKTGAAIIFATTGPVRDACVNRTGAGAKMDNAMIIRYNAAVTDLMKRLGVTVNDVHPLLYEDRETLISDDLVHPTPAGVEILAKAVAASIRKAVHR